MRDDSSSYGGRFFTDIRIDHEYELRYWTWKFGVTVDQLLDAVKAVGILAVDVEKHLKGV